MRKPHFLLLTSLLLGALAAADLPYHHHTSIAEPETSSAVAPEADAQDLYHVEVTTRDLDLNFPPSPESKLRIAVAKTPDTVPEPTDTPKAVDGSNEEPKAIAALTKSADEVPDISVKGVVRKGGHKKAAGGAPSGNNGCTCCCCHHEGTPTYHLTMPDPCYNGLETISLPAVGPPYRYGCGGCQCSPPCVEPTPVCGSRCCIHQPCGCCCPACRYAPPPPCCCPPPPCGCGCGCGCQNPCCGCQNPCCCNNNCCGCQNPCCCNNNCCCQNSCCCNNNCCCQNPCCCDNNCCCQNPCWCQNPCCGCCGGDGGHKAKHKASHGGTRGLTGKKSKHKGKKGHGSQRDADDDDDEE